MGMDCAIQMDLPSSETEGAVISFMEASIHIAPAASTAIIPLSPPKVTASMAANTRPFISSSTAAMGSMITPSPQLSI